jgi:hypothetical protein
MTLIRAALFLLVTTIWPAFASELFPFGSEMMLEAAPMHGSKRMPILEIDDDGATSIDLWCSSVQAQSTVGADGTITIVPGGLKPTPSDTPQPAQCTPERETIDQDLVTSLSQVTGWRRNGDLIELSGATALRFRLMTN